MSDSLQQMSIFAKVVSSGSLSAAARELGLSPAVVSRSLSALEARLVHGVTSFNCVAMQQYYAFAIWFRIGLIINSALCK